LIAAKEKEMDLNFAKEKGGDGVSNAR